MRREGGETEGNWGCIDVKGRKKKRRRASVDNKEKVAWDKHNGWTQ